MAARSQGCHTYQTHLPKLTYTSAVIAESMRLFPPVYVIGREATTDLELGGYRVKRGYTVLMSQ
jgi:cytochrome P450